MYFISYFIKYLYYKDHKLCYLCNFINEYVVDLIGLSGSNHIKKSQRTKRLAPLGGEEIVSSLHTEKLVVSWSVMLLIWLNTNITFITFSDEYNRKMRSKQQIPVISNIEITAALTNFCGLSRNYWQEIHDGPASCSNIRQCQWFTSHTSQNLISSRFEHIWAILPACQACWN